MDLQACRRSAHVIAPPAITLLVALGWLPWSPSWALVVDRDPGWVPSVGRIIAYHFD